MAIEKDKKKKNQRKTGGLGGKVGGGGDSVNNAGNTGAFKPITIDDPSKTIDPTLAANTTSTGSRDQSLFRKGTLADPGISDPKDTSGLSEPGSFQVFGKNGNNRDVEINGSRGYVSKNVADSLGSGGGTFNTINMDKYRESQRLTNARNAVATLKAQGASASAQLSAFRQITKPTGSSLRDQLEAESKGALGEGNYAKALSLSKGVEKIDAGSLSERQVDTSRLSKERDLLAKTAKTEREILKEGLSSNKDLNTLVSKISSKDPNNVLKYKHDKSTRISLLERGFRTLPIDRNTFKSSLGEEYFKEGETDAQALERIEGDPSLPASIRQKARVAFSEQ